MFYFVSRRFGEWQGRKETKPHNNGMFQSLRVFGAFHTAPAGSAELQHSAHGVERGPERIAPPLIPPLHPSPYALLHFFQTSFTSNTRTFLTL
jgi:hypothetical protein